MNSGFLIEGILLGMSSFGMVIDKWENDILYISVPKDTTDCRPNGEALAGKKLAAKIQADFTNICDKDIKVKYKIRDETWTKEKADKILYRQW